MRHSIIFYCFLLFFISHPLYAKEEITLLTGSPTDTYVKIGQDIKDISSSEDISINVRISESALESIYLINKFNELKHYGLIGVIQIDVLSYLSKLSTIDENIFLYSEQLHLLAYKEIKEINDLKGKTIITDYRSWEVAHTLFSDLNVNIIQKEIDEDILDSFLEKKIENVYAIFMIGKKPIEIFERLNKLNSYRILADKLHGIHFIKLSLPQKKLDSLKDQQNNIDIIISHNDYSWMDPKEKINTLAIVADPQKNTLSELSKNISRVFDLYPEEVHLLAKSGVNDIMDLINKKVIIGSKYSGTWVTANNLFRIFDISDKVSFVESPIDVLALSQFLDGDVDAIFYVGGQPIPLLQKLNNLAKTPYENKLSDIHFIGINLDKVQKKDALTINLITQYQKANIKKENYGWMKEQQIPTIQISSSLVAYSSTESKKLACKIPRIILKNILYLANNSNQYHAKWQDVRRVHEKSKKDIDEYISNNCSCTDSLMVKQTEMTINRIRTNKKQYTDCDNSPFCITILSLAERSLNDAKKDNNNGDVNWALEALRYAHNAEKVSTGEQLVTPSCLEQ